MKDFRTLASLLFFLVLFEVTGQVAVRDSLLSVLKGSPVSKTTETLIALSEWYSTADFGKSMSYASAALTAGRVSSTMSEALALTNLAKRHWENGAYASSIALHNQSLAIREASGDTGGIAANNLGIALNFYYTADFKEALVYYQRALDGFRRSGDRRMEAEVLNRIGLVYHLMGDYVATASFFHDYWRVRSDFKGYQGRYYNLGVTSPFFRSKDYFERELALQLQTFEQLKETGNQEAQLLTCLNIADTYKDLGNFASALKYHKEGVRRAESMGRVPGLLYLGNAYRSLGSYDSALQVHMAAIELVKSRGNGLDFMWAHRVIGEDLRKMGRMHDALEYYYKGLEITSAMNNKLDVVICLQRIAAIQLSLRQFDRARSTCLESLELVTKIGARGIRRDGLLLMSETCSSSGDFRAALGYLQQERQLTDSLIAGEADLQFAQMQAQYELEKKTTEIEKLSQEKSIQKARLRSKDLLLYGSLTLIGLTLLLAASTYMRFRQKHISNRKLRAQKHQIEVLLSEVHHRVKNNLQVIASLLSVQSNKLTDESARFAVLESQSRVYAMGLIHENIYGAESFTFIQMEQYLTRLCSSLCRSFGFDKRKMEISIEANNLSLDVDTAIPLGLIINELMTNCLKHAFASVANPSVSISLKVENKDQLVLKVSDNGKGLGETTRNDQSFGLNLVSELADQLQGSVEFVHDSGLSVQLKFRKFKLAA